MQGQLLTQKIPRGRELGGFRTGPRAGCEFWRKALDNFWSATSPLTLRLCDAHMAAMISFSHLQRNRSKTNQQPPMPACLGPQNLCCKIVVSLSTTTIQVFCFFLQLCKYSKNSFRFFVLKVSTFETRGWRQFKFLSFENASKGALHPWPFFLKLKQNTLPANECVC